MSQLATRTFEALGTTATIVSPPSALEFALTRVGQELDDVDRTCSRFRPDSDLTRLNDADGRWLEVDALLVEAIEAALRAARVTGGLVDPTIGNALLRLGYDRDFSDVPERGPALDLRSFRTSTAAWELVELRRDRLQVRLPRGVRLDLGSTGKAFAADRAATLASAVTGVGVLVSLGGDLAVSGPSPEGGWPIGIADDHAASPEAGETISITAGGVATSSTTVRRWRRGDRAIHHIIDPRTGLPADEVWRTASVCAATCVDANTASTAAIVLGEQAPAWLARQGLPARLVRPGGETVRVGGWPERAAA